VLLFAEIVPSLMINSLIILYDNDVYLSVVFRGIKFNSGNLFNVFFVFFKGLLFHGIFTG